MTENLKQIVVGAFIILIITMTSYTSALQGGFIWDDDAYVENNITLRSGEGLNRIWFEFGATPQYYPLVFTTFWVEYNLWGLNPFGYHFVNVLIHCINALLFFIILKRLQIRWCFFAALLFAIHPVHVESVAWVTELKNVLSGMFYLLSMIAYFRFSNVGGKDIQSIHCVHKHWKWYAFSLLFYLCALLSKTVTCSLPVALMLITWWKTKQVKKMDIIPLIPFFLVGAIMGLTTIWMEKTHVGAEGVDWTLSVPERLIIAGRAVWFYGGKLLWPDNLIFSYPKWNVDTGQWLQWVVSLSHMLTLGVLWFFKEKIGRGPITAIILFFITLSPALGFIDVYPMRYSYAADHFQYLASLSFIALIPGVVLKIFGGHRKVAVGVAVVIVVTFSFLTWKQGHAYKSREVLWRDIIEKNQSSWMAHNNLGIELVSQNKIEEAISHYKRSLDLHPDNPHAHNNLGVAFDETGRLSDAIIHYNRALELNPDLADAHVNLGMALSGMGKKNRAIDHFKQAIKLKPFLAEAHNSLATELALLGQNKQALFHYSEAIRIKPESVVAYVNTTNVLLENGKYQEAIPYLLKIVQLAPGDVISCYRLGVAFMKQEKLNEAEKYFLKVLTLKPDSADSYNNLGIIRGKQGRLADAIEFFSKALVLKPELKSAIQNLQFAQQQMLK